MSNIFDSIRGQLRLQWRSQDLKIGIQVRVPKAQGMRRCRHRRGGRWEKSERFVPLPKNVDFLCENGVFWCFLALFWVTIQVQCMYVCTTTILQILEAQPPSKKSRGLPRLRAPWFRHHWLPYGSRPASYLHKCCRATSEFHNKKIN